MKLEFRRLKENEIECRIGTIKKDGSGLSLLLYKDARCDMNILDETVGATNWKKKYDLIDGQLFCTIEIYDEDKNEWVGKQDVGTESNTEAEKGRASDAQKRSAFAWGIGRELYTAPFIWITAENANIKQFNGKWTCNDKFTVEKISYKDNGDIDGLSIINEKLGKRVFVKKPEAKKTGGSINNANITIKQHFGGEE